MPGFNIEAAGIEKWIREIANPLKDNDFRPIPLFSLGFLRSI
jgi:hypothetical protein